MPIITISRGSCSGGARIADALHERLGWKVLSQEDVSSAAALAYRMTEQELFRGLYLPANFFERFTHRKTRYLLATQATVTELLEDGNGIYHGLAGQFLFADLCNAFKVRIVAPMDDRIETAMQRFGLKKDEARQHIRDADEYRSRWGRQIFHADITDADLYDLVVNLEHVNIDRATTMIAELMEGDDYQPTPQCIQDYQDFALERRVRAELFFNSPFTPEIAHVEVRNSEVTLSGGKAFAASEKALIDFVGNIRGVEKITTDHGTVGAVDIRLDADFALSSRDATAADVMLPPENYPHCRLTCTIREAVVALSASAVKLQDGYIMLPRYVLVLDDDDRLVGVVSRRELLKGLIPHLHEDREAAAHIKELVPFGGSMATEVTIHWTSLFSRLAIEASMTPIQSVMVPIKGAVQIDDTLSTVISTMLFHGVDLVAVLEGEKVAGVVLMTNIFDIVAQFIMEYGQPPDASGGKDGDDA
ncbi:MAG: cytidylate kinase family protein [Thermoanaerobaculales bacterium]|nr:cytidylate kinase family protein [Thermoanaerobaculales bacterium]